MQNAEKNYVVYVTDFGADLTGQTDSAEAVIRAMERQKDSPGRSGGKNYVGFSPGTYQFYPDKAEERELYVSNTVGPNEEYKYKKIGILVEDINHLTVEGNESQFIFHGQITVFCRNPKRGCGVSELYRGFSGSYSGGYYCRICGRKYGGGVYSRVL